MASPSHISSHTPGRLTAYLHRLANHAFGTPTGFAGRTCFQAIPALELERRGDTSLSIDPACIRYPLPLLLHRKDCQDFAMVGLLHMLCRYPQSQLLTASLREEITHALLQTKYDEFDPGPDSCCWHTENHQVQYASSELLAGQLWPNTNFACTGQPGHWHAQRATTKLHRWLDWRLRFSFSEWNSSCYYDEDAAALLNLIAHAHDPAIRQKAQRVFSLLLLHVALNSWRGLTGGSQGRAYFSDTVLPEGTAMATLAQVAWGDSEPPARLSLGAVLLAAGDWQIPQPIIDIATDLATPLENRERHGLDADEGPAHGLDPSDLENLHFFLGAGQEHHHLVTASRVAYRGGKERWPGDFADHQWYQKCLAEGRDFDRWCLPHALGRADVYTYRTADYMLGCVQDYHPGAPGYQQLIWSATLGPRTVIFTNNPAPADVPYGRPGPWVGNGVLPKVVQHRNVLIALHRVRPVPIYDQPPWFHEPRVHAWFPQGMFDRFEQRGHWCFGRKNDAYIGLRAVTQQTPHWRPADPAVASLLGTDAPYEWNIDETDVAFICELGSAATHGSFESFCDQLTAASVEGNVNHLRYNSPTIGSLQTGWHVGLHLNGVNIPLRNHALLQNRHLTADFAAPFAPENWQ